MFLRKELYKYRRSTVEKGTHQTMYTKIFVSVLFRFQKYRIRFYQMENYIHIEHPQALH